jgi:outer membrane protein assembly factor BamA
LAFGIEILAGVKATLLAVGAAAVMTAQVAAAETIREIVVERNTKSTDETVLLIADVEVGDDWTPADVERVKVALVNSGLFKEVEVVTTPSLLPAGGLKLVIMAKDKHSWVIAPTFYNQPTNKGGGVGFGENNLFGENEKLLLYGQIATGDSFFIGAYIDPSIAGSRFHWQFDVFLKSARTIEYAPPSEYLDDPDPLRISRLNYLNSGVRLGMKLWKLSLDGRLRGARVSYSGVKLAEGATLEEVTGDPAATVLPAPGARGYDISTEITLGYDNRANWYGISTGNRYVLSYETGLPALGSDFSYWYGGIRLEQARKFYKRHNFIVKVQGGYGRKLPFQQEFLTGGTSMRGWKNAQFRGDLRLQANLEYSFPIFTIKGLAFRGLGFWDSAYTTFLSDTDRRSRDYLPGSDVRGLAPLKNSVGLGMRLYLRQLVLPLLGLDFGYGLERNDFEMYVAIGLTD